MNDPITYRLSAQQRLLVDRGRRAGSLVSRGVVELPADLDSARVRAAVERVVAWHESLRTHVTTVADGTAVQHVRATPWPLSWRDDVETSSPFDTRLAAAFASRPGATDGSVHVVLVRDATRAALAVTVSAMYADAASLGAFASQLREVLAGRREAPDALAQYAQFAAWQDQLLDDTDLDAASEHAYWRARVRTPPMPLPLAGHELATHDERPTATHSAQLDADTTAALHRIARDADTSLAAVLLTAWQAVCARLTGSTDALVGVTRDGRGLEDLADTIGPIARVVPMRVRVDTPSQPTFAREVARVGTMLRDDESHVDYCPPGLVHLPVQFDATSDLGHAAHDAVRLSWVASQPDTFALRLAVRSERDTTALEFAYDPSRLDAARIERIAAAFVAFVRAGARDPHRAIDRLPLLDATARADVLTRLVGPTAPDDAPDVLARIAAHAAKTPDALAVRCGDARISFGELDRRAHDVAHALRRVGVQRGSRVGLCAERSIALAVGVLGVLRAGAAYVPLDPAYPTERLSAVLTGASPVALLAQSSALAKLPPHALPVVDLDAPGASDTVANPVHGALDAAYLMFTSGSTGRPKGVVATHGALARYVVALGGAFGLGAADVYLHTASIAFSSSVRQLLVPLAHGASVAIATAEQIADPLALLRHASDTGATVVDLVPSYWRALVDALAQAPAAMRESVHAGPLRTLLSASEPMPWTLAADIRSIAPATARFVNLFGQTETTGIVDAFPVDGPPRDEATVVPLGRPLAGTREYVLDACFEPVPHGVAGELFVGGEALARGYTGRASLTAERFVPDPFGTTPGARLYRTGDRVRIDDAGALAFVGRDDDQVKVRGMRVELGEIAAAIARAPDVRESAVVRRVDEGHAPRLVAYVVLRAGSRPEAVTALRASLRTALPEYMVPAFVVTLPSLPRGPNGKIDRAALPAPERVRGHDTPYVAPRTPVELELAGLWARLLRLERVGIDENFFDLGGQSITATTLIYQTCRAFDIELPVTSLFSHPTIARLALAVTAAQASRQGPVTRVRTLTPQPAQRNEPFPLTDVQQAYWIGRGGGFEMGNIASTTYREVDFPELDVERLSRAFDRLIARHDMLRAIVRPDGMQQVLADVPPLKLPVLELRGVPRADADAQLAAVRAEMSHTVLRADRWPVFDVRAARLDDRTRLFVTTDYLLIDAFGSGALVRELWGLYLDPSLVLPPLEVTFRDYVLFLLAGRREDAYARAEAYWRERLPTLPLAPDLPLARDPASLDRPRFVRHQRSLGAARWEKLAARARRAQLTPSAVLAAAYADVLAAFSRRAQFSINLTTFNRPPVHPQINDILGDFTTLTILAVDGSTDVDFESRAKRLQDRLWHDLEHGAFSGVSVMRELVRSGRVRVGAAVMPVVFTSTLALADLEEPQRASEAAQPAANGQAGASEVYNIGATPQVWLDSKSHPGDDGLVCIWDSVDGLFPTGFVADMFAAYCALLEALADDEAAWKRVDRDLLPASQRERRARVNATDGPVPTGLLHQPFAAHARARPDAPAVIAASRTLSHGELSARAADVRESLRAHDVRPGELVAIVMDKGWEQVVAALGIVASGAAYLPIDPTLPTARRAHLLARGACRLALTQPDLDTGLAWPDGLTRLAVTDAPPRALAGLDPHEAVVAPDSLAYVIFTSGSTGEPKGVMIDHRGALNTVLDVNARFHVGPSDRTFALSSLGFDLSVYDVFGLLAAGGALVVPPTAALRDPALQAEWLARGVTIWNSVPALMQLLVEYGATHPGALPDTLRLALLSGDWIPVTLPDRLRAQRPGMEVISLGGATEASIWSIAYPIDRVDPAWRSIPYGVPMKNQRFFVYDASFAARPDHVPGDLYIGGIGLAHGYWRDDERTRASFVTHPRTGEKLYRTGDLGRYLPDGTIEFLGREDGQVKVQGFRIELGEIEATLERHPRIRAAAAAAFGAAGESRRLVGYYVVADEAPLDAAELREHLREKLPDYMIPASWVQLDALPLSANGKVDRAALPQPAAAGTDAIEETDASLVSDAERALQTRCAGLVAQVMGRTKIAVGANLVSEGAHSIDLMRIVGALETEFGSRMPLAQLFSQPTVAAIARFYAAAGDMEEGDL